jgi:iron complex outermembrane receptor protein
MKNQTKWLLAILAVAPVVSNAELGQIVVTPVITEQDRELSPTPITVIDRETIIKSGAKNLAELLRGQAGLNVRDLYGDGNQSVIDLRGFGPTATSNTLIMIDGRRLNNSTDTAAPEINSIDLADIEQIEILQGSGGVLYGNQAVGGVVNIIRRKYSEDKVDVGIELGSYNSSKVWTSIAQTVGEVQLWLQASDASSDNYRDHNDSEKRNFSLRANHQNKILNSYIDIQTTSYYQEAPGALLQAEVDADRKQSNPTYKDDYFDTDTDVLQLGVSKDIDPTQSFNLDYSKRFNDVSFIQSFRPSACSAFVTIEDCTSIQDRDTQIFSGKYVLKPENSMGSSVGIGFNLEDTDYMLDSQIGQQAMDQSISDVYVAGSWYTSKQGVVAGGVRYSSQDSQIDDSFTGITDIDESLTVFNLSYTHQINKWKLYARADQNYRYPTVEEHTNTGAQPPGLRTQEGVSYELGAEYFANQNRYRATIYSIDLENEIAFDTSGFTNMNLDSTSREGLILEALKNWTTQFSTTLAYTLLNAEISSGPFAGNKLPLVPEQTLRLSGLYQFTDALDMNLEIIAVGEQVFGGDFDNSLGKLDSYQVANLNLGYAVGEWQLGARVNNLLDHEYSETGSEYADFSGFPVVSYFESFFPSPERNYWLSARYRFQ